MQPLAYTFEQQLRLLEAQRYAQAARAKQLRLAKAATPSASPMSRLRTAIGGTLIAAGERMRQDIEAAPEVATAHAKADLEA